MQGGGGLSVHVQDAQLARYRGSKVQDVECVYAMVQVIEVQAKEAAHRAVFWRFKV